MNDYVVEMENISKVFETDEMRTIALNGVSLKLEAGDYVSISGPSGCGKSTLLSILGLLDSPSEGRYLIDGHDVSRLSAAESAAIRNQKLGFVFQSFNLIDELSVFDNVALPLRYRADTLSADQVKQRVMHRLEQVEMSHRVNHKPNQLSGGQQQRIAIARSLVSEPALLLVDEPTGNLDAKNGDIIMDILGQFNQDGTTLCMVTHEPRYARMANTQWHLLDGKISH